jgi:hypothetical protein
MRNVIRVTLFIVVFIFLENFIGIFFIPMDLGTSSVKQGLNEKNEIAFIGSSHVFCTYDVMRIEKETGIKTGMLSHNNQPPFTSTFLIKKLIDRNKENIIFLDTYMFRSIEERPNVIRVGFLSLNSLDKIRYIYEYNKYADKSDISSKSFLDSFNLITYHSNWSDIDLIKSNIKNEYTYRNLNYNRSFSPTKGYYPFDESNTAEKYINEVPDDGFSKNLINRDDIEKIPECNQILLLEIIELCKSNNVKLVLLDSPYYNAKDDRAQINYIKDIATNNMIEVIDFNEMYTNLNLVKSDFKDTGHTNKYGSAKTTQFMIDWLSKEYDF